MKVLKVSHMHVYGVAEFRQFIQCKLYVPSMPVALCKSFCIAKNHGKKVTTFQIRGS